MAGKLASRVRGLSEAQFREAYGTEERCRAVVEKLRWPAGFVCPLCGGTEGKWLSTRPRIQCRACRQQVSLTAGTIFHATKLPLTAWFLAMWLVATAKNGISSVELGRRLGIKQTNAWALKQKIMAVMAGREGQKRLDGRVEMDDAYLGGHRPGKRGRGAAGKQPFVAAVSTSDDRRPRKIKLLPVKGFRKKEVKRLVAEHLASTSRLVTDGLSCWTAAAEAGLEHTAMATGSGKRAAGWSPFRWVNTTLGNIKAAITGTYRRVSPEHAGRYLGSFAWRHNRRFQLESLIPRLVHSAVRTAPLPYAKLVAS
jgi:ISXO2 transposase-like protein/transposase-like zinc ribbon protein